MSPFGKTKIYMPVELIIIGVDQAVMKKTEKSYYVWRTL